MLMISISEDEDNQCGPVQMHLISITAMASTSMSIFAKSYSTGHEVFCNETLSNVVRTVNALSHDLSPAFI